MKKVTIIGIQQRTEMALIHKERKVLIYNTPFRIVYAMEGVVSQLHLPSEDLLELHLDEEGCVVMTIMIRARKHIAKMLAFQISSRDYFQLKNIPTPLTESQKTQFQAVTGHAYA